MNILVTGAGGFVGKHLIRHLPEICCGHQIYALGSSSSAMAGVHDLVIDMSDEAALRSVFGKIRPRHVYHLAGVARVSGSIESHEYFRKNYLTSAFLMREAARSDFPISVFFTSSAQVYGNQPGILNEHAPVQPVNYYGYTKYLAEQMMRSYAHNTNHLRVIVGRLSTCAGPGQTRGFVIPDFCRKIARLPKHRKATLSVGPLDAFRQFLDVADLVALLPRLLSSESTSRFEIFNIAPLAGLHIRDVLKTLLRIAGKSPRVKITKRAPNQWTGNQLDIEKLKRSAPGHLFRPIEETLERTYRWVEKSL